MQSKNHFKFYCKAGKSFIQSYKYNGFVEELFDDAFLVPCQCTGIKDNQEKYIYEGDIIEFERQLTKEHSRKFTAIVSYADGAFLVMAKTSDAEGTLSYMWLHDLSKEIYNWKIRVIGNKFENPELT
jgi:uncharacterized phage protein (TIGR01671 family)